MILEASVETQDELQKIDRHNNFILKMSLLTGHRQQKKDNLMKVNYAEDEKSDESILELAVIGRRS